MAEEHIQVFDRKRKMNSGMSVTLTTLATALVLLSSSFRHQASAADLASPLPTPLRSVCSTSPTGFNSDLRLVCKGLINDTGRFDSASHIANVANEATAFNSVNSLDLYGLDVVGKNEAAL